MIDSAFRSALAGLLAVLGLGLLAESAVLAQPTYIHAGHLIDGTSNTVTESATIVVEDDTIRKVTDGYASVPEEGQRIDVTDQYVLPGLIDLHVHLTMESSPDSYINRFTQENSEVAFNAAKYAKTTLMAGFTTVRDVGGRDVNIHLRDAIAEGDVPGPRIRTSGNIIGTTGSHADPTNGWRDRIDYNPGPKESVVDGPYEARAAVRHRYKNGADLIKITATGGVLSLARSGDAPQFKMDELNAIVETAADYGMHVAVHAHGAEGMKRAIRAGVHTIEHGTYMTPNIREMMKEKGVYHIPTITAGKAVADSAEVPGYYPDVVVPKAKRIGPLIQETFAKSYEAGVPIAFGTDASVFAHGKNAMEFEYMVEAGMPPMEAIQSATSVAADVLGMGTQIGQVTEGYKADLIAVPSNPLETVETLQNVTFVMKNGTVFKQ